MKSNHTLLLKWVSPNKVRIVRNEELLVVYRYSDCCVLGGGIMLNKGDEDTGTTLRVQNLDLLTLTELSTTQTRGR
jgi:hypothetical protein